MPNKRTTKWLGNMKQQRKSCELLHSTQEKPKKYNSFFESSIKMANNCTGFFDILLTQLKPAHRGPDLNFSSKLNFYAERTNAKKLVELEDL